MQLKTREKFLEWLIFQTMKDMKETQLLRDARTESQVAFPVQQLKQAVEEVGFESPKKRQKILGLRQLVIAIIQPGFERDGVAVRPRQEWIPLIKMLEK